MIGLLFRRTAVVTSRSELVILLSPRICGEEPIPAGIAAARDRLREMSLLSSRNDDPGQDKLRGAVEEALDP